MPLVRFAPALRVALLFAVFFVFLFLAMPARSAEPARLTLAEARRLALERSPSLAAALAEARARDGSLLQAGLAPNPQLASDVQDFSGSGQRSGFDQAQTTLRLSQLIELGGKRQGRINVAKLERDLAGWDIEEKRLAAVAATTTAFVRALAARDRQTLGAEAIRLARESAATAKALVRAGAASPAEATRADLEVERTRLAMAHAQREASTAMSALAATWGDRASTFRELDCNLDELEPIPALDALEKACEDNPALARWAAESDRAAARLALEASGAVPDVTLGLGVRYYREGNDAALVAEASVPLPLWNRNQGAVAEASHRVEKARLEGDAARLAVLSDIRTIHARLVQERSEAEALRTKLIPGARRALDQATAAFRSGAVRFLEVLDAQRALVDARTDRVQALESFHTDAAELERLTSPPLSGRAMESPR